MKNLLLLLLLLSFVSCDDDDALDCPHTRQGDNITLADGTMATVAEIEDVRCPCNADCLWAGYIGMTITVGGDTILRVSDVFGGRFSTDSISMPNLYYTSRGDRIMLVNHTQPSESCDGSVDGADFCLELLVE